MGRTDFEQGKKKSQYGDVLLIRHGKCNRCSVSRDLLEALCFRMMAWRQEEEAIIHWSLALKPGT